MTVSARASFHMQSPCGSTHVALTKAMRRVLGLFVSAPPAPPDLSRRLTLVIEALRRVIAARAGRDRAAVPIVLLVWPYLHRLAARFEALARRVRAGGSVVATPRTRPASLAPPSPAPPSLAPPSLAPRCRPPRPPRSFAWLIRLAPDAAQLGGQIRHLLADPELASLLAAAPQAGRILRPLCRMLGILPGPDLPAALFRPRGPPRSPAQPLPPAASPVLEPSAAPSPAPQWPAPPGLAPRRRARPRLPLSSAAPA